MADKITSENKIRADTLNVNSAKIDRDEVGDSRNMTGTGKAGNVNISKDSALRPESRNVTQRDIKDKEGTEEKAEEKAEEGSGKRKDRGRQKQALTNDRRDNPDADADDARKKRNKRIAQNKYREFVAGSTMKPNVKSVSGVKGESEVRNAASKDAPKNNRSKKVSRSKNKQLLSRSEMQTKKAAERAGIQKKMTAAMTAAGVMKEGLYDTDDGEEISEKLVRKGKSLTQKIGNHFYQKRSIKEKTAAEVRKGKAAQSSGKKSAKVKAPKKKDDGTYKVNANARKQAAEQAKKEQARRSQEMQAKKAAQKRMIHKQYAKEVREKEKVKQTATKVSRKIQELAAKHSTAVVVILLILLLFLICFVLLGSCALGAAALSGEVAEGTYQSKPIDIENTELEMQYQEALLQYQIDTMQTTYPGYDEYHVIGGPMVHDPFALIAYFSAKYGIFTYEEVAAEVDELAALMYQLTFTESQRGPYITYVPDGNGGYTLQTYYITTLTAEITMTPLEDLIAERLNAEQMVHYERLMETKGALQRFAAPVEGWSNGITEPYGIQSSPAGLYQNSGVYVHVESGSNVQAMCSGTVTAVGSGAYGNYVTITHEDGYVATIAGISSISVSVGSTVELKESLGTTNGDLYFEISYDGVYYNPHFFVHY